MFGFMIVNNYLFNALNVFNEVLLFVVNAVLFIAYYLLVKYLLSLSRYNMCP